MRKKAPAVARVNNQVPVPTDAPPRNWSATQIVYSKIGFRAPSGQPQFFLNPSSYTIQGNDVAGLVADLLSPHPALPHGHDKTWGPPKPVKRTPLDIQVDQPCYVVLQLDPHIAWKFREGGPALTTKLAYPGKNAELRHVGPNGVPSPTPVPDCKIVYFAAVDRSTGDVQEFNFYVAFEQTLEDGRTDTMEVMIDPDIPNGNGEFLKDAP
jgi:hypothetical protein